MKTSIDLIAPASAATAGDRECALQVMRAVRNMAPAVEAFDVVLGLEYAKAAGDIIAAHCAAATANERQAREKAEGENARLREALEDIATGMGPHARTAEEALKEAKT